MKKIHITLLLFFVVGLFPVFAWAQVGENYVVEIEGRYWNPKLDASVKIVKNDVGTHFTAVDDLGFDEKKDSGEGRIQIKFAKKHNPIKYVGISGGYRYFETKFKYDNNSLDFKLDGPLLALKIRF